MTTMLCTIHGNVEVHAFKVLQCCKSSTDGPPVSFTSGQDLWTASLLLLLLLPIFFVSKIYNPHYSMVLMLPWVGLITQSWRRNYEGKFFSLSTLHSYYSNTSARPLLQARFCAMPDCIPEGWVEATETVMGQERKAGTGTTNKNAWLCFFVWFDTVRLKQSKLSNRAVIKH